MSLFDDRNRTIFSYNAHTTGFGGRLTKPCCEIIPSQASVSLAQSGGEGYSTVRNYNYKGLITFDEASAYVTGSEEEEDFEDNEGKTQKVLVFNTLASVTVRNLNIANMVHVDLLAARLTSRHPEFEFVDGKPNIGHQRREGDITFEGSFIKGLTIAGEAVDVDLDPLVSVPTYAAYKAAADLDADPKAEKEHHIYRKKNTIHVREFGKIYVAEVVMKRGQRRLGLLRFDLGCAVCGDASSGNVEGNGTPTGP